MKNLKKIRLFISWLLIILPQISLAAELSNPLGSNSLSASDIYARIIYSFLGVTGSLSLIMFVVGGFQWMTAGGSPERVKKGRDTLVWAVFGLVVIFASYAILRAVFGALRFG